MPTYTRRFFSKKQFSLIVRLILVFNILLPPVSPGLAQIPDEAPPADPADRVVETWPEDGRTADFDDTLTPEQPPLQLTESAATLADLVPETFATLTATVSDDKKETVFQTQNGSGLSLSTEMASVGTIGTAVTFFDGRVMVVVDEGTFSAATNLLLRPVPVPQNEAVPENSQALFDGDGNFVGLSGRQTEWLRFEFQAVDVATSELITNFARPVHIAVDMRDFALIEAEKEQWQIAFLDKENQTAWVSGESMLHNSTGIISAKTEEPNIVSVISSDPPVSWKFSWIAPTASEFSGAATYEYPVETPPGRNGLQPDLTIRYSSRGVDSLTKSPEDQG